LGNVDHFWAIILWSDAKQLIVCERFGFEIHVNIVKNRIRAMKDSTLKGEFFNREKQVHSHFEWAYI